MDDVNEVVVEETEEESENNVYFFDEEKDEVILVSGEEFDRKDLEGKPQDIWSIQGIWNELVNQERAEPKKRDYISFSDIGKKDYWSRYMKMIGVPVSNPTDERVLRVFSAGDMFHDLVKLVFKRAGLFINSQDDFDRTTEQDKMSNIPATEDTLRQYGMYDILAGGKPDYEKTVQELKNDYWLPPFAKIKAIAILKHFIEKYPNGLKPLIYEVKSINSQAFWNKKGHMTEAYPHHKLQLFGYLKANNISEGRLLYVSKDDLMLAEFPVFLSDKNLEEKYNEDVRLMSKYILNKQEPPKPPYIVYNRKKKYSFQNNKIKYSVRGCYEMNWEVVRSPYFTLMTGFESSKAFADSLKEEISSKNKQIKEKTLKKFA